MWTKRESQVAGPRAMQEASRAHCGSSLTVPQFHRPFHIADAIPCLTSPCWHRQDHSKTAGGFTTGKEAQDEQRKLLHEKVGDLWRQRDADPPHRALFGRPELCLTCTGLTDVLGSLHCIGCPQA